MDDDVLDLAEQIADESWKLVQCRKCRRMLPRDAFSASARTQCRDCRKYHNTEPIVAEMRCPGCGETKPASGFYRNKSNYTGLSSACRECHNWRMIRNKYNLTRAQFASMWEVQDGKCYFGCEFGKSGTRVDHDHETDIVRGLLCHTHNVALGGYENMLRDASAEDIDVYLARGRR